MADPVLYSFRRCPYAMRARMALAIADIKLEHREVLLRGKPQAMLDASPKGTVPVLVLEDGTVIDESIDIMHWALGQNDPEGWLNGAEPGLIAKIDGPFKHHLDRYKYSARHDSDPEEHRAAGSEILREFEQRLNDGTYLCGTERTLADIATFPFIRQFAHTDREWFAAQTIPQVQRWLAGLIGSGLFKSIMVKRELWQN